MEFLKKVSDRLLYGKKRYRHSRKYHNPADAAEIVPYIIHLLQPKSVVDVGCGTGSFLKVFKEQGVEILGIEGEWTQKQLLYIAPEEVYIADLEKPLQLPKRYDLAVTLEVAEHISEKNAPTFVKSVVDLSDVILFSAAIPKQLGQNHLNEQWIAYWQSLFREHGYEVYDVLRHHFWDNKKIWWWYRQNMYLVIKDTVQHNFAKKDKIFNYVHPDLYSERMDEYQSVLSGRESLFLYILLFFRFFTVRLGLTR